ncbi:MULTISPECIES: hypothetical protein [unclassified Aeromonas]|nr:MULTISPECIES: hypothetical protein [unclassified Aeromonas]MBP4060208.1 hypothetical protein [Aeromonas sp. Prich7-2]
MPALIPELIALANDPAVKTADLLRRALVGEPAEFGKNRTLRFSGHP